MKKIVLIAAACFLLSGCATWGGFVRTFLGTSTQAVEETRASAIAKIYPYDYNTTYTRVEKLLGKMPKVKIYAKTSEMIALYCIDPNTTPVGVFFTEKDPAHTRVAVSSPGIDAKQWVAKNVFSQAVLPATPDAPKF